MTRLKERDRRPVRKFQAGDIVTPHPKRSDLITVGQGIVLRLLDSHPGHREGVQQLLVFFAARDTDLFIEARRYARSLHNEPGFKPDGMVITNSDLQFVLSEPTWLDAPTIEEVQMQRFFDVGSEL